MEKGRFNRDVDDLPNYGLKLAQAFYLELIEGGAYPRSPELYALMDMLYEWKKTDDPSYLDMFSYHVCKYGFKYGTGITWELAKAAHLRLTGAYKDREGAKGMKARVVYARREACQWIFILHKYCGVDVSDAVHMAAARLHAEKSESLPTAVMMQDSLEKEYYKVYKKADRVLLDEYNQYDYWTAEQIAEYKGLFVFKLPFELI